MNDGQRDVFNTIDAAVLAKDASKMFFIDAPGGTGTLILIARNIRVASSSTCAGKTYVLNALLDKHRHEGLICIAVSISGVAALSLHGGRTAHSTFRIPVSGIHETSTCAIKKQFKLAKLLRQVRLIVWDEAPMANKNQLDAVDRTLRVG